MDTERSRQFAQQFVLHQDRIYGYIVTMPPNRQDAEDVFQQTSLILWQAWDEFDPGGTLSLGPVALPATQSAIFSAPAAAIDWCSVRS